MAIVTISRVTLSGGEALAECLADRLGYRCISQEVILNEAAKKYGVPEEKLRATMDKPPTFWQRVEGTCPVHLIFVRASLCAHAREGNLVYRGFAGHLLPPRISHVIHVCEIEDMEFRIKAVMQQQNLVPAYPPGP